MGKNKILTLITNIVIHVYNLRYMPLPEGEKKHSVLQCTIRSSSHDHLVWTGASYSLIGKSSYGTMACHLYAIYLFDEFI